MEKSYWSKSTIEIDTFSTVKTEMDNSPIETEMDMSPVKIEMENECEHEDNQEQRELRIATQTAAIG